MSGASRPGGGEETTSANVVCNLPASVSRSCIVPRTVGRRMATGSSEGNLPGRLRVPMSTMRHRGIGSGDGYFFRVARVATAPGATAPHLFDFSEGSFPTPPPARRAKTSTRPRPSADLAGLRVKLRRSPISAHTRRTEKEKPWPPEAQGF